MATKVKPCRIKATGTPQAGYVPKYVDEDTFQWGAGGGGSGDVVVSTDTGNELSTGVALWFGTESDYSSISTPDTNTLYIQYKSDGGGGWQPGVNTLAYYKLEGDANDYSGNGYDGTWNGTSNYATLTGGKVVAQFDYNSSTVNYIYSSLSTAPKTVSFWMKLDSLDESNYQNRKQIIGQVNSESGTWQLRGYITPGNECFVLNGNNISYAWTTNWIYVTLLLDGTTISLYVNGTKLDDLTNTSTASSGTLYIGGNILGGNNSMKRALSGKMSEVILESELWTEQNITDYFNQTKANYGIS